MICRNCGKEIPDSAKFCKYCGTPVQPASPAGNGNSGRIIQGQVTPPQKQKKSPLVLILVIIVIVLSAVVCLSVAAWYFKVGPFEEREEAAYDREDDDSDEDDDSSEASSSDSSSVSDSGNDEENAVDEEDEDEDEEDDNGEPVLDDNEDIDYEITGVDAFNNGKYGYILPYSDSEELTESDLEDFSNQQLTYARNEIYAREQCVFKSSELNGYFKGKEWYDPKKSRKAADYYGKLSSIEQRNADFIRQYQDDNFGGPYKPD